MNLSRHKLDIALLVIILAVLNTIVYIDIRHFAVRGLESQLTESIDLSLSIVNEWELPETAFYPPGVPILLAVVQFLGVKNIDPYVFNAVTINVGALVFYLLSRRVIGNSLYSFAAVLLMILNPYFVCTALLSRDVASEFFFSGLLFLLLFVYYKNTPRNKNTILLLFLSILLTAIVLALVRATDFFVVFFIFVVSIFIHKAGKNFFCALSIAFACFTLFFMYQNYKRVGAFSLSTNSGINLYIGNHPLYLHGHPHYDIDVFLGTERIKNEMREAGTDSLPESEEDAYFRRKSIEFIRADNLAFLYRVLVKSVWHWFNLEIIPNYTSSAYFDGETDTIIVQSRINMLTSLAYVMYKFLYLPLFVISMAFLWKGRIDKLLIAFYMPYVALWPVVVLAFPDTRFKIVAEVCVLIPMIYSLCYKKQGAESKVGDCSKVPHGV